MMSDEKYGRSPLAAILPLIKAQQALDRRDIEDGGGKAMERLFARRRPLWRLMGLISTEEAGNA